MHITSEKHRKFNAVKHGILSRKVAIHPGESRYGFRKLKKTLLDQYSPEDEIEIALVEYLTVCFWRMKRALRIESKIMHEIEAEWEKYLGKGKIGNLSPLDVVKFERMDQILRYINGIQKGVFRTIHGLETIKERKMTNKDN